jgi:hypothetical protein
MSKVSFKLIGGDRVLQGLKRLSKETQERVSNELQITADDIARGAISKAAANFGGGGGLRSGIGTSEIDKYTFTVFSARDYSAYVEFGTGAYVSIPSGLEEYAKNFMAPRPVKREVNLPARPFFFNTFEEERVNLIKRLKEIIRNAKL